MGAIVRDTAGLVALVALVARGRGWAAQAKSSSFVALRMTMCGLTLVAGVVAGAQSGAGGNGGFTQTAPAQDSIHLMVGRSTFITTHARLSHVYITNPKVLDSYTVSPNQVLCTAKEAGLSSLILWDEAGQSHVYMVSVDLDMSALQESIKKALPHEGIAVRGDEGKIVLTGVASTDAAAEAAVKLAGMYGKDVSNAILVNAATVKQVRLKVRMIEVDRSRLEQFGFNLFGIINGKLGVQSTTSQYPSSSTVTTATATAAAAYTVSNPLNFVLYSFQQNIGATIQDLENKQIAQILAEPTITTLSGQKATFLAGGEFPFPVVQGGGGVGGQATVTIQFRSYGVKLDFTPLVNPDGTIELKVAPEVSALDYTNSVTIAGYVIPAISTRRADTQVVLSSGQSFAISGLLDKRTTDSFQKTPGISSVPVLGNLFKSKGQNHSTTELIVLVTPEIVDPVREMQAKDEPTLPVPTLDPYVFDRQLPNMATKAEAGPAQMAGVPAPMQTNVPAEPTAQMAAAPLVEIPTAAAPEPQPATVPVPAAAPVQPAEMAAAPRIGVVYMIGAFKAPGTINLTAYAPVTLMQAAKLCGGPAAGEKYHEVRVIHKAGQKRTVTTLDIREVLRGEGPNPILEPNDVVYLASSDGPNVTQTAPATTGQQTTLAAAQQQPQQQLQQQPQQQLQQSAQQR